VEIQTRSEWAQLAPATVMPITTAFIKAEREWPVMVSVDCEELILRKG
jgi:hypothetical protein